MWLLLLIYDDVYEAFTISPPNTGMLFHAIKGTCKIYVSTGLHLTQVHFTRLL